MPKKKLLSKVIVKKAGSEAAKTRKSVAKEGGRVIAGTGKGFLGAFSPFR